MDRFLDVLFELEFRRLITPRAVKPLFIAGIICHSLITLGAILIGFSQGLTGGIIALAVAPVLFLVGVTGLRLLLEAALSLLRIANYSAETARAMRRESENQDL